MTAARIFLYLCFAFLAGTALASFFYFSFFLIIPAFIFSLALIGVFWERPRIAVFGFCLILLALGILRLQAFESEILEYRDPGFSGKEVNLVGRINAEPDKRPGYTNLKIIIIAAGPSAGSDDPSADIVGSRVSAAVGNYPEYSYGDKVRLKGGLKLPEKDSSFNWPGYLAKEGISWQIVHPKIELLEKTGGGYWPSLFSNILELKKKFQEPIRENIPLREGSLLSGLLLGDRSLMPKNFKQEMSAAGLSHITAVSGMNVVILSSILMSLLIGLGLWRQQAFWLALAFIWLFVLLVGLPASAVRAGIMASLLLSAQFLGRQNMAWRAMILAAAAMLAFNPLLLRYDVGFQLSFLAVAGLIFIEPMLKEKLNFIPDKRFFNLKEMLSQTLSAQIATLPILIYNFGSFSLIAPLANILVLPAIPWLMALGFIFVLAGIVLPALGWLLSWPVSALLIYCTKAVDICASLPFAQLALNISPSWLFLVYILIFIWAARWRRKRRFLETGYLS
ncbi:MAG: ComEC/Rec2 family competence protein [Candidatus Paceibacterota bacterium]|jgi:competence protein ComEC